MYIGLHDTFRKKLTRIKNYQKQHRYLVMRKNSLSVEE